MSKLSTASRDINLLSKLMLNPELSEDAWSKAGQEIDELVRNNFDSGADTFHIYAEGVEAELGATPIQGTVIYIDPDIIPF